MAFSVYFIWMVGGRLEYIWRDLLALAQSPGTFFSGGYRIVIGLYFLIVGLSGGLCRFKESHQEWKKLRGLQEAKEEAAGV